MKKIYLLLVFVLFVSGFELTNAQGIYQFWGTTDGGGSDNQGTLFSTRDNGTGHKPYPAFSVSTPGSNPAHQQPILYNNKFYGMMQYGGLDSDGIIYEYNPATNEWLKKVDLYAVHGKASLGNLVVHNGKMYGVTSEGGVNDKGILLEYDPATNACIKRHDFAQASGITPKADLVVFNNKLYGLTYKGGANDAGVLFEFDPATNIYTKKKDMVEATGGYGWGGMIVYNGKLYGVTYAGGANDGGVLFSYEPGTNTYTPLVSMAPGTGTHMKGKLVVAGTSLYGAATWGGSNSGVIFQYVVANNQLISKHEFTFNDGYNPQGTMVLYNNKLYGMTTGGGADDNGMLYQFDLATNIYQVKVDFSFTLGISPEGGMLVYNDKLYGFTNWGGTNGSGLLFEYNPAINGYQKKVQLRESATGTWPSGQLTYYNGNLYGITSVGGNNGAGTIYKFDLSTQTHTVLHHFVYADGSPHDQGGFAVVNNKFYGVTYGGGPDNNGVIYEFDPATNNYTKHHDFVSSTDGRQPVAAMTLFTDNKLYGTCLLGGANGAGTIFQFDPVTKAFQKKVDMTDAGGSWLYGGLTSWNGFLWGMAENGGINDMGTIYKYNPLTNVKTTPFHFDNLIGGHPQGNFIVHNNELWGVTANNGLGGEGTIISTNGVGVLSAAYPFQNPGTGTRARGTLLSANGKLYGMTAYGSSFGGGELFEYDDVNNEYNRQTIFNKANGAYATHTQLVRIPAIVSPGNPGNCKTASSTNIDNSNNNQWIPFTDEFGNAVAEINANGNVLGRVQVNYFVNNGAVRADGNGRKYLDRNITITVDNQPVSPVSVRLYIRKTEFEKFKNEPGTGVGQPADLSVFKNDDACGAQLIGMANKLAGSSGTWGVDYVYTVNVNSFSTFYFSSRNNIALPFDLLSFKGNKEAVANKLQWEASCTDAVDFYIERSENGTNFQQVGLVMAQQQDCSNPFTFFDQNPPAKSYYRLKMVEQNGPVKYSQIILLNRDGHDNFTVSIFPNPVVGSHAGLQINAVKKMTLPFTISDAMGRVVMQKEVSVQPGINNYPIPVNTLSPGVYQLVYTIEGKNQVVRFVKQ
jgi:uncharacterized repeat protein (TIGR03803 family)